MTGHTVNSEVDSSCELDAGHIPPRTLPALVVLGVMFEDEFEVPEALTACLSKVPSTPSPNGRWTLPVRCFGVCSELRSDRFFFGTTTTTGSDLTTEQSLELDEARSLLLSPIPTAFSQQTKSMGWEVPLKKHIPRQVWETGLGDTSPHPDRC